MYSGILETCIKTVLIPEFSIMYPVYLSVDVLIPLLYLCRRLHLLPQILWQVIDKQIDRRVCFSTLGVPHFSTLKDAYIIITNNGRSGDSYRDKLT